MKIDVSKAELPEFRQKYYDALNTKLGRFAELNTDVESCWNYLQSVIHQSTIDTFGCRRRLDPNWYRELRDTIEPILEKKRAAMLKMKSRLSRASLVEYHAAQALAQKTVCESVKVFWDSLCSHIEIARDSGNIKDIFTAIKTATKPSTQTCRILKDKNGSIIEENS